MLNSWIETDNCDMCAGISVPVLLCCNQLKKNLVIGWGEKILSVHFVYLKPVSVTSSLSLSLSLSRSLCSIEKKLR